jgi:hypothetical protein
LPRPRSRPTRSMRGFWPICYAAGSSPACILPVGRPGGLGRMPALFFRPPAHDAAQSHSSAAWRPARTEVAAMQRPLRPQGRGLLGKAGAPSAGQASIYPATDALKGTGRAHPINENHREEIQILSLQPSIEIHRHQWHRQFLKNHNRESSETSDREGI